MDGSLATPPALLPMRRERRMVNLFVDSFLFSLFLCLYLLRGAHPPRLGTAHAVFGGISFFVAGGRVYFT
jgi:hypothetical protein